jgi:hypothetical protein
MATRIGNLVLVALVLLAARTAAADVPSILNFSGRLTTSDGDVSGVESLTIRLYDHATSTDAGHVLWQDTQEVAVEAGRFHVLLGADPANAIVPEVLAATGLYVGLTVGADAEMVPRVRVASVPFALRAADALTLGGKGPADFALSSQSCSGNDKVIGIDVNGFLVCGTDAGNAYTFGSGLVLAGGTVTVDQAAVVGWAKAACFDSASELFPLLDERYAMSSHNHDDLYYGKAAIDASLATRQPLLSGTCGTGFFVSSVNPDGSFVCSPGNVGTVTSITAGAGLTGGTITGNGTIGLATPTPTTLGGVRSGACSGTDKVTGVDANGAVTCGVDQVPAFPASAFAFSDNANDTTLIAQGFAGLGHAFNMGERWQGRTEGCGSYVITNPVCAASTSGVRCYGYGSQYGASSNNGFFEMTGSTSTMVMNCHSTSVGTKRDGFTMVEAGDHTIAWGGENLTTPTVTYLNTGWVDGGPSTTSLANAPSGRRGHSAVWTGQLMIVWGGTGSGGANLNDGGRYNLALNQWTSVVATPPGRHEHTAVWTGERMIVWGGQGNGMLADGWSYDPVADSWSAIAAPPAGFVARYRHSAIWTGKEMIVYAGINGSSLLASGAAYNPSNDTWRVIQPSGAPPTSQEPAVAWTGKAMVVFGVRGNLYDPDRDEWYPMSAAGAPPDLSYVRRAGAWLPASGTFAVWGGTYYGYDANSWPAGGFYSPGTALWAYKKQ